MINFGDLGLSKQTLEILEQKGYQVPSDIQQKTIPILLQKTCDVVGQSQTGTGKTAAFGLPIVENLLKDANYDKSIKAVILTPSRELAIQIGNELRSFIGDRGLSVQTIYGGQSYLLEKKAIKRGIDILVGTPGRVIDHLKNKVLDFSKIQYFVLDEADEMLNMGFIDDIKLILQNCPKQKTSLFFSATMPAPIMNIAKKYMNDFQIIKVESDTLTSSLTDQFFYVIKREDKLELLYRVIDMEYDFYGIIFCKTKVDVDMLTGALSMKGYNVDCIHGDISQKQRETVIKKFKMGKVKILIATDVAARGLDINNLSHVINHTIPQNPEEYTHRIGRTGRAGKKGIAISFVGPSEIRRINFIKGITKSDIKEKKIPSIDEVLNSQLINIKKLIGDEINLDKSTDFNDIAKELLKLDKPEAVLSSVLSLFLQNTLSKSKYGEISSNRFGGKKGFNNKSLKNSSGERLFIARGRKDGMTPKKMVDYISIQTGIQQRCIDDMQVMQKFSFCTVEKKQALQIVNFFKKQKHNGKSLVTFAKS